MSEKSVTTVAVGRFDDLLARGLRGLIEDDQSLELVAGDIASGRARDGAASAQPARGDPRCRARCAARSRSAN